MLSDGCEQYVAICMNAHRFFFFFSPLVLPAELMHETYGVKIQGKELIAAHRSGREK